MSGSQVDMTAFGKVVDPIISNIVYPVIALLFGIALLVFVWGVLKMVIYPGDEEVLASSKRSILYGTIGLFIMVSAWGIVYLVSNTVKGL